MRIVDARSGKEVRVGEWVVYRRPATVIMGRWCPDADGNLPPGQVVQNPEPGVDLPGHGVVSEDSYRILELRDQGWYADIWIERPSGFRGWGRGPIRGEGAERTVVSPS